MFERASSVVCSRSTSLRRDVVCAARVPAPKRWMKSMSCAIFFSRWTFSRLDAGADLRLGHHHVVVAAGVGDDGLVVDVGDVRADRVEEVAVVRDDDERAVVALAGSSRASGSSRGRGGWSARRGAAPWASRRAPAPGARAPSGRPAVRPSGARAARRGCRAPAAAPPRCSRRSSRPPRRRCPRARRAACRPRSTCPASRRGGRARSSPSTGGRCP